MDADEPEQRLFSSEDLHERLISDYNFYHRVAGLSLLAVVGISDEVKENARNQLKDFLTPDIEAIPETYNNNTEIYLANISKAQSLWVLSVPANFRAFCDYGGLVHLVSIN
jgi:hypothetical protein